METTWTILYRVQIPLPRGGMIARREGRTTTIRWDDEPVAVLTVVWVDDASRHRYFIDRDLADRFGLRPAERDWLFLSVDLDPATAAQWRTAAESYLTAIQAAERDRHAARDHPPWFRRRAAAERARARHRAALDAADNVYAPVREAASRLLDERYAPIAAREKAIAAIDGKPIWRYVRKGKTAHVHVAGSRGSTADELISAMTRQKGITAFRWEPDAVARAVELLGEEGFELWWSRFAGHWQYRLEQQEQPRRAGGTGLAGTGGFGI
ncbi:hypothetical protein O3597_07790 [Verrucosispora sp. WMMA2044]|uniref:hypothetical protein n=1 Tax=Verrucosispora sp. WMMA2044 TaxID=3016419 RepID=UPI00248AEBBE|nr:hypothetical protein [Verrucosispora sp. WMMA2044]WBB50349.1 hypothetical protein O3597_07790 [Verrucosispora sp. WMMA2044]